MIFPGKTAGKISRGEVRFTIRPAGTKDAKAGKRLCVKASQKSDIAAYVIVTDVAEMRLGDITFAQARAAGYRTTNDFKAAWVRWRDKAWIEAQEVTEDNGTIDVDRWMTDDDLLPRFEARHANRRAVALTLKLDTELRPRYLATQRDILNGRVDDGEYTTRRGRSIDDLEVIDAATQARYSKNADEFCLGRQRKRQEEAARAKADRGRSMRLAPHERMRRAA